MDKEAGGGKARIHLTLSRVGSPPLVVMESDKYNIEDEAWADTMDPKTGSVFYVDPVNDPEPSQTSLKPPGSPLLIAHGRTSSAGEIVRTPPDKSPKWGFRKMLTSVGGATPKRTRDDADFNSFSEPDLRSSPRPLRNRNKYVNPFATSNGSNTLEPQLIHAVPPTPTLSVHVNLQSYGKPCALKTLGIIPARPKIVTGSTLSLKSPSRFSGQEPVIVRELLSDSVVSKKILPGDHLVSVNGYEVHHSNVDVVLAKVGLTADELVLQVVRGSGSGQAAAASMDNVNQELVKLLSRKGSQCSPKPVHKLPHMLMYLTLNTAEDDEENKDILYMYPTQIDSSIMNKVYHLRALCLTLTDVMTSSVASGNCSCTSISVDGQLMSLVSIQYDKELMMLAIPAYCCSVYEAESLAKQVEQVLNLLYQTPQRAFTSEANKPQLSYLFGLFFDHLFAAKKATSLQSFQFCPSISLPVNLKVKISSALTSLDSADFSSKTVFMYTPMSYSSLGSCLFHKGNLVCSHLADDNLKDVILFSMMHSLLKATSQQKISQLVIWRKIYLRRLCHQKSITRDYFMLAVGLGYTIVYQLMESSIQPDHNSSDIHIHVPDAITIDKMRSLIMELDAKGVLESCEAWCSNSDTSSPVPCTQSIDAAMMSIPRASTVKRSVSLSVSDFEEMSVSTPISMRSRGSTFIGIGSKKKSLTASLSAGSDYPAAHTKTPYMLTTGLDNVLFHYVSMDWARGVFISPTSSLTSLLHEAMLDTFGRTCVHIRQSLYDQEHNLQNTKFTYPEDDSEEDTPHRPVLEQGVLVQCPLPASVHSDKHSKNVPRLSYWIVGRRLAESGREFYVCFQDSVPQSAVELAFRLHFGSVD